MLIISIQIFLFIATGLVWMYSFFAPYNINNEQEEQDESYFRVLISIFPIGVLSVSFLIPGGEMLEESIALMGLMILTIFLLKFIYNSFKNKYFKPLLKI